MAAEVLRLHLMTLIYKYNLDILNMSLHTKVNFPGQGFQKLEHYNKQTHRHTDTQVNKSTDATENITTPHSPMVKVTYRK